MILQCLITCPFPRGIKTSASELMGPWLTIGDPLKDIILNENNTHKIHQPLKINDIYKRTKKGKFKITNFKNLSQTTQVKI